MEEDRSIVYSRKVRAGKRTYFIDVKPTQANDFYITITESKRRQNRTGGFFYEKHKIFLYKEDFMKFLDGIQDAVGHIQEDLMPDHDFSVYAQYADEPEDYFSQDSFNNTPPDPSEEDEI